MAQSDSAIDRLKAKENPVLYSPGDTDSVCHIPVIEAGEPRNLCFKDLGKLHSSPLASFARRRNPRLCGHCENELERDRRPTPITDSEIVLSELEQADIEESQR